MKFNHVLIIYKRQVTGIEGEARPSTSLKGELASRQKNHDEAISVVSSVLDKNSISFELKDREGLGGELGADLLIAIGGDGTALAAAHFAGDTPMLCLNSMPGHSIGFYCMATVKTFSRIIEKIITDKLSPKNLPLIEADINDQTQPICALNELLFAGASPAETVRYEIYVGAKREMQRSSGVWIAAGPGSTAVIRSAGGKRQKVESGKLQFVVREPCLSPEKKFNLTSGLLKEGEEIKIVSEMIEGRVYVDGSKINYPVAYGATFTARISPKRLKIFL